MAAQIQRMKRTVLCVALTTAFPMKFAASFIRFPDRLRRVLPRSFPFFDLHFVLVAERLHFQLHQQHQVVRVALELAVRAFCLRAARPGFPLLHFAFEFAKHLLDVPPAFVDDDELVRGQRQLVGEVGVMRPIARIGVVDAPQRGTLGVADEVVAAYPFVARIGEVDEIGRANFRSAVGFLDGDEIDPAVVL